MCTECDLSMAHKVYLCVTCRVVWKVHTYSNGVVTLHCTRCGLTGKDMGFRWRAPKLSNKKAWKLIDQGDYLWDKRAIRRNRKAQAEDTANWVTNPQQKKPKGILPKNWRRKFM